MIQRGTPLLALLALALGGCVPLLDDSCGPTLRITAAEGTLHDGATLLADVTMELVERRGGGAYVHDIIMGARESRGAPLRDHVTRARLVHAGTGAVLHELPLAPGPVFGDEVIGATQSSVAEQDAVRRAFLDGDAVLELLTDLPDHGRVLVPLPDVRAGDWGRASCS